MHDSTVFKLAQRAFRPLALLRAALVWLTLCASPAWAQQDMFAGKPVRMIEIGRAHV